MIVGAINQCRSTCFVCEYLQVVGLVGFTAPHGKGEGWFRVGDGPGGRGQAGAHLRRLLPLHAGWGGVEALPPRREMLLDDALLVRHARSGARLHLQLEQLLGGPRRPSSPSSSPHPVCPVCPATVAPVCPATVAPVCPATVAHAVHVAAGLATRARRRRLAHQRRGVEPATERDTRDTPRNSVQVNSRTH
jgi:hypothetical protein